MAESAREGSFGPWDWNGIVGTGQSLSVGTPPVTSVTQAYGNLKLSLGSRGNAAVPPWDSLAEALAMVPLVEPIRELQTGYPSAYPANVYGETLHSAMARQMSFLARAASPKADHVTVHTVVGESGQGIVALERQRGATDGIVGRAYAATLFEAQAIARLARSAGKTYGVAAIVMTHGETDSGNPTYAADLSRLLADYNTDLRAITGQAAPIPMYLTQQHAFPNGKDSAGRSPLATQVQWRLGVERRGEFVCVGPKYQMNGHENGDGVHLSAVGYQLLGEKVAQVHFERALLGNDWRPLEPIYVERSGRAVIVHFHVPLGPLTWELSFDPPAISEWARARGFELRAGEDRIAIESVAIHGESVRIEAVGPLPSGPLAVGYASASQGVQMSSASNAVRWGQLRDSDPFRGETTKLASPNYCVSFELPIP
jgi:lysophospholipase L1-like esterase